VITIVAFFVLTIFVVPKIGDLVLNLGGPHAKLPPQTVAMLAVSKFIRHQWYIVGAVMIGGPMLFNRWRKTPKGKQKQHTAAPAASPPDPCGTAFDFKGVRSDFNHLALKR